MVSKAVTIYLDEGQQKRLERIAADLKTNQVIGLFNVDGKVNRSAVIQHLIDHYAKKEPK